MNVILLSLLVSLMWGITPIIKKYALKSISPIMLIYISGICYFIGTFIIGFIYKKELLEEYKNLNFINIFFIMICIFGGGYIAEIIFLNLLKNNKSAIITALTYSSPFFTLALAYFILNEKIKLYGIIGIFFITIGIIFIGLNNYYDM